MQTSYFAKYRGLNGVSIALKAPNGFRGKQYKLLAPSWDLLKKYKNGEVSDEQYTEIYKRTVLDRLDPDAVYNELSADAVLLCWERPEKFCHRHLVAEWLNEKLGLEITEV
jgi:uncharacterized protein (DUF488 family)